MAQDDLSFRIRATDDASKVLDDVADKTAKLDGASAEVDVTATDKASQEIDAVFTRVDALDKDTATVILSAEGKRAQAEIDHLTRLLGKVDGDEAVVALEARDQATAKLDRIEAKMREVEARSPVEVDAKAGAGLGQVSELLGKMPGQLGDIGGALGSAGVAGGVTALGAALVAVGLEAKDTALEAGQLATFIGSSVEDASRLLALMKPLNIELGDISDIVGQTTQVLSQQPDLVKRLGINIKGASPAEAFLKAYDAVLKVQDAQERLNLMNTLFGEQGARQVSAVVTKYGDLRAAMKKVNEQQVITQEDLDKAKELDGKMTQLKVTFQGLAVALGQEVVPALSTTFDWLNNVIGATDDGIASLLGPVGSLTERFGDMFGGDADKNVAEMIAKVKELTPEIHGAGEAARNSRDGVDMYGNAVEDAGDKSEDAGAQIHGMGEAARDSKDDIDHLRTAWSDFKTGLDAKRELNDIGRQFDDVLAKGEAAFAAAVAGSEDAEAANRDYEDSFGSLQTKIGEYLIEVLKIPESVATDIVANLDKASAQQIDAWIKNLEEGITIPLFAKPPGGRIGAHIVWDDQGGIARPGDITVAGERGPELLNDRYLTTGPTIVPPGTRITSRAKTAAMLGGSTTIITNVNMPRGYRELDAAAAANRVTKRSGRLYAGT